MMYKKLLLSICLLSTISSANADNVTTYPNQKEVVGVQCYSGGKNVFLALESDKPVVLENKGSTFLLLIRDSMEVYSLPTNMCLIQHQ